MTSNQFFASYHNLLRQMVLSNIKYNWQFILDNAKKNVHCQGLHSVVIDKDEHGMLKRIFFTDINHEMWRNSALHQSTFTTFPHELSVGIHAHHCDLALIQIYGQRWNLMNCRFAFAFDNDQYNKSVPELKMYNYVSDLVHKGKGHFVYIGQKNLRYIGNDFLDDGIKMTANQLHTVAVTKGEEVAWLVIEEKYTGKKALPKKGEGKVYTNANLENFNFGNYYHTMHESEVRDALKKFFGFPDDVFP